MANDSLGNSVIAAAKGQETKGQEAGEEGKGQQEAKGQEAGEEGKGQEEMLYLTDELRLQYGLERRQLLSRMAFLGTKPLQGYVTLEQKTLLDELHVYYQNNGKFDGFVIPKPTPASPTAEEVAKFKKQKATQKSSPPFESASKPVESVEPVEPVKPVEPVTQALEPAIEPVEPATQASESLETVAELEEPIAEPSPLPEALVVVEDNQLSAPIEDISDEWKEEPIGVFNAITEQDIQLVEKSAQERATALLVARNEATRFYLQNPTYLAPDKRAAVQSSSSNFQAEFHKAGEQYNPKTFSQNLLNRIKNRHFDNGSGVLDAG